MRIYVWLETLLRKERERSKQLYFEIFVCFNLEISIVLFLKCRQAERLVRENFGRAIARGVDEMNLKKATVSPIQSIIENAVHQTYRRSPGLQGSMTDTHLKDAIDALNAFYISERAYEVHMIFWLYPIQLAFEDVSHQRKKRPFFIRLLSKFYLNSNS